VGSGRRATRQSRFELRVGLGTLLELDERPARLPGWGVVTAGVARELAAAYAEGEWRVAVTDDSGALVAALITGHRPADAAALAVAPEPPIAGAPRPVVELHVSQAQLDRLHPGDHPGWTRLLTDLQHQHAQWRTARAEDQAARHAEARATGNDPPGRPDPEDLDAGVLDAGVRDADGLDADGLGAGGWARVAARRRERAREAVARFPSVALRRWITMRDRSCVFPPCGASALAAEIDHTRAVVEHGLTAPDNLGPVCGHDHDLKDQGWRLTQPRPGWFVWTSPTGHTYPRPPRPVTDELPDPRPPTVPSSAEPDRYADDGPIWDRPPHPPPGHPPDPPRPPPPPPDNDPDPPF
jgi:hypothetical protein